MKLIIDDNKSHFNIEKYNISTYSPYGIYFRYGNHNLKLIPLVSINKQLIPFLNKIMWKYNKDSKVKLEKIKNMINNNHVEFAIILFKNIYPRLQLINKLK